MFLLLSWCACQECVDGYVADARWFAEEGHNSRLQLDESAVYTLRGASAVVIEAASCLWGQSSAARGQAVFLTKKGHVSRWCGDRASRALVGLVSNYERARQMDKRIRAPEGVVP